MYIDTTNDASGRIVLNASHADSATMASRLDSNAGSSTLPVYFSGGVPVATGTSLAVSVTGNAATATKLKTARTISISDNDGTNTATGTSFNGSANITVKLPTTIKANLTGNADTASIAGRLNSNAGDKNHPIYFESGIPQACDVIYNHINTDDIKVGSIHLYESVDGDAITVGPSTVTQVGMGGNYADNIVSLMGTSNALVSNSNTSFIGHVELEDGSITAMVPGVIGFAQRDADNDSIEFSTILTPEGLQGNAATATLADKAKALDIGKIGSATVPVYFDGGVPTVCTSLSLNTSGNAATATKLKTARNIGLTDADGTNTGTGFNFDGSAGGTFKLPATIKANITGNISGTAAKADALTVNGGDSNTPVYFAAGVPTPCTSLSLNTSGNAATATQWANERTINLTDADGTNTGTAVTIDGTKDATLKLPATIKATLDGKAASADKLNVDGGDSQTPVYFSAGVPTPCTSLSLDTTGNAATATNVAWSGVTSKPSYYDAKAIKSISRSGTTFTATHLDGTTSTFDQQDNNSDTKVTQTVTTTNANYPLLLAPSGQTATTTTTSYFDSGVTLNPNTNTIAANISGNAATATTASSCSGNAATATVAASCSGNAATATNVAWSGVTGKPSTFTPSGHTHPISQVTWSAAENLSCTGDSSEWSIDMSADAPNSYFHIWSGYLGNSCMKFENKTGICRATYGVYGAVWNDYAEYRDQKEEIKPGYCVASADNGQVYKTTKKFQACDGIVSDTFGFAIGETDECKTPLAVAGRVLAYCEGDRYSYHSGDTVCAGPDGKIVKMTREEIREWPDRIIGIVSEIPEYETWGTGNVAVDGRIWIKVK